MTRRSTYPGVGVRLPVGPARATLLAVFLMLLPIVAAAQGKNVIRVDTTGEWTPIQVNRNADDPANPGGFAYCATENTYSNGLKLAFARNREGSTNIAIGFPDDRLRVGSGYELRFDIDGTIERVVEGFSPDPKVLVLPTGPDQEVYGFLRSGARLNVEGPEDIISFQLKGTSAALGQLQECVVDGRADVVAEAPRAPAQATLPAPGAPPAPGSPPAAGDLPPGAQVNVLPPLLTLLLTQSQLGRVEVLELSGDPRERPMDFAWRVGEIFGGVKEVRAPEDVAFGDMVDAYINGLAERCLGDITRNVSAPEQVAIVTLARAEVRCAMSEPPTHASILFYNAADAFSVIFHEATVERSAEADSARDRIAGTIRRFAEEGLIRIDPRDTGGGAAN